MENSSVLPCLVLTTVDAGHPSPQLREVDERERPCGGNWHQKPEWWRVHLLRKKVAEFVNKTMGVQLLTSDIVACHELPSRKDERVKLMIVSLINNAVKRDVVMGRQNLKGTRIYVNERLTQKNAAHLKKK